MLKPRGKALLFLLAIDFGSRLVLTAIFLFYLQPGLHDDTKLLEEHR